MGNGRCYVTDAGMKVILSMFMVIINASFVNKS